MKKFLAFIKDVDRRVIYLMIVLSVIIPMITGLELPTTVTPEVQAIFDHIQQIPPHTKAVLISFDFDPSTQPELQPMAKALIRHCIYRKVPVFGVTMAIPGVGLGVEAFNSVAAEYRAENLVDYTFLGFQTPPIVILLGFGEDIHEIFPEDYSGAEIREIPMMETIRNYDDVALIVSIAGNTYPLSWMTYAGTRYGAKIAAGVTAVSAADFYMYLQTGQLIGMMGGIKGAAEYEQLLDELETRDGKLEARIATYSPEEKDRFHKERTKARRAMNPQSVSHLMIIAFILLGNITYFAFERKRKG